MTTVRTVRPVALAVDPAVMPIVEKSLANAGVNLGELQGGKERLRTYNATGRVAFRLSHIDLANIEFAEQIIERIGVTRRQVEILRLIAGGHRFAEIGRRLGIAESYASEQAQTLYRLLGAVDRAHAVGNGFRLGLLVAGA